MGIGHGIRTGPGPGRDVPPLRGPWQYKKRDELGIDDALPFSAAPPTKASLNARQTRKKNVPCAGTSKNFFKAILRFTAHFAFSSSIAKQERDDGDQDKNGSDGSTCNSAYITSVVFGIGMVRWGAGSL